MPEKIVEVMTAFLSNGHETPAYLVQPAGTGPYPAVVAVQEWWGLVPHIKDVAQRFAQAGFIALAPDLYHGAQAGEPDEARKMAMSLDRERAVQEIKAAIRYLQERDNVQPKRVGLVGWCLGGGLALSTAADDTNVGAVVAFYGRPLAADDTARLKAPVLGLYAAEDKGISVSTVREFEAALNRHQVPHEIQIYEGAQHAFFNDTRPVYDERAATDAWQRTLAWFNEHLG